jgi:lipopolysaccharide export system protein LptA
MLTKFFLLLIALPSIALANLNFIDPKKHNSNLPIEIEADNLTIDDKSNAAIFVGNVKAKQGDLRLTSGKLIVHYKRAVKEIDKQSNQIKKIVAYKDVFISNEKNSETANSEEAIYEMDNETLELNRNVTLTQGQNIVKGERLIYNGRTGVVHVFDDQKSDKFNKGQVKVLIVPEQNK